jgi:quinohemoprotein ethanol dehydrogenase
MPPKAFRTGLRIALAPLALLGLAAAACSQQTAAPRSGPVDAARITAAAQTDAPGDWLTHGRTYSEQRYSPLAEIAAGNVAELGLAWSFDLDTDRGQEATPLLVDGVLYFSTAWSKVFAVDARTGQEKWRFDPQVPPSHAVNACCDVVNRGVAAWGTSIFVGTLDGRLIALDRESGRELWSVATADPAKHYTITGAPRVVKGRVLIGNGGAEYGVRGYVSAYDAATGALVWRFYTVPGDPAQGFENAAMEMAAKTWAGEWWKYGGGGTVWDSMAYDPELDLLYVGVGNGSPWNHQIRSQGQGDNLFLSSIVALRPDTGEYVWHFQTTPGETWDYTATQHMILADLAIDGRTRKVILQAPKNGFFYVLDRATGEFISGRNFAPINWATGLDPKTGRPVEVEAARFRSGTSLVIPGPPGAHNWNPMSYHPGTGLVFIPATTATSTASLYAHDPAFQLRDVGWNTGLKVPPPPPTEDVVAGFQEARSRPPGTLLAWDPVQQREVWRVEHKVRGGSGLLSTGGGLVFQGTGDNRFHAFAAATGAELWSFDAGNAILGGPITYELDGVQYVVALAGRGGVLGLAGGAGAPAGAATAVRPKGRLLCFALGAKGSLPVPQADVAAARRPLELANVTTPGDVARGRSQYGALCTACHGPDAVSSGTVPDLRFAPVLLDAARFRAIVVEGALRDRGMVGFAPAIGAGEAEDLRAYLVQRARESAQAPAAN